MGLHRKPSKSKRQNAATKHAPRLAERLEKAVADLRSVVATLEGHVDTEIDVASIGPVLQSLSYAEDDFIAVIERVRGLMAPLRSDQPPGSGVVLSGPKDRAARKQTPASAWGQDPQMGQAARELDEALSESVQLGEGPVEEAFEDGMLRVDRTYPEPVDLLRDLQGNHRYDEVRAILKQGIVRFVGQRKAAIDRIENCVKSLMKAAAAAA